MSSPAPALGPAQAAVSRSGVFSKFDGVDEIVFECTNATSFANVPQMARTFTISGSSSSAAVVTFSGSASLSGAGPRHRLRPAADRRPAAEPGRGAVRSTNDQFSDANAFTWQTKPLAVGSHKAQLQWRTDQGSSFCLDARSLVVLHRVAPRHRPGGATGAFSQAHQDIPTVQRQVVTASRKRNSPFR